MDTETQEKEMTSIEQRNAELQVEYEERFLSEYLENNMGPLWGEDNEVELENLKSDLRASYEKANTPLEDRRVDV